MDERKKRKKRPDVVDLREYREKRNFEKTREPPGGGLSPSPPPLFVVQKHAARRLHYDFRLEADGVLKSWAVPKGPSYDPAEKRLAVHVEDHPLEYADFEGIIAEHQYGAGTVMVWDRGTWSPVGDWKKGLEQGHLKFRLDGEKLKGEWALVRIKAGEGRDEEFDLPAKDNWLLIKHPDETAKRLGQYDVTSEQPLSVKTGRSMEAIESQKTAFWEGDREAGVRAVRPGRPAPPPAPGPEAPWPESFLPQLATLVERLPENGPWLSEIKFDGYRLIASIRNGEVVLTTRRGQNWTEIFLPVARELSRLPLKNAILDGEVVALNPDGTANFQKLQNSLKRRDGKDLIYYVFDVPYYQDHDLSQVPLHERKELLRELVNTYGERMPAVRYSEHLEGSGERVLRAACGHGAEGVIAKRSDSPYLQKRTRSWVKKKCINRQEFVVGGFTEPGGTRSYFGSLLLGYYDEQHRLVYCGNVGTGFNEESIRAVYDRLKQLEQDASPFASVVDDARKRETHWIAPRVVAEVEYVEWTEGGHLRHPSFVGIREDKKPDEITRERATPLPAESQEDADTVDTVSAHPADTPSSVLPPSRGRNTGGVNSLREGGPVSIPIKLTNPERIFYPDPGLTKKDLAEYYLRVGQWMLPEAANRPLVLVRCPEGITQGMRENCFFQKHLRDEIPEAIRTTAIEEKGQLGLYPVVDDMNGLLSLVQLGVLEIHMLGCRADAVEHPDRMIFDLDPAPEVPKGRLVEAARYIVDWLSENKMRSFLKLTGGKGIHIVVPINPVLTWEEVKKLSNGIALDLVHRKPAWFVSTVSKRRRSGKILIDYLRNSLGASSIVPYSTRARAEATVALPISETELTEELLSRPMTVKEAIGRVKSRREDPWGEIG